MPSTAILQLDIIGVSSTVGRWDSITDCKMRQLDSSTDEILQKVRTESYCVSQILINRKGRIF